MQNNQLTVNYKCKWSPWFKIVRKLRLFGGRDQAKGAMDLLFCRSDGYRVNLGEPNSIRQLHQTRTPSRGRPTRSAWRWAYLPAKRMQHTVRKRLPWTYYFSWMYYYAMRSPNLIRSKKLQTMKVLLIKRIKLKLVFCKLRPSAFTEYFDHMWTILDVWRRYVKFKIHETMRILRISSSFKLLALRTHGSKDDG